MAIIVGSWGMSCQYLNLLTIENKQIRHCHPCQAKQTRKTVSKYNVRPCHRIDTGRFHFLWKSCINASANNVQRKQPNLQAGPWEPVNGKTEGACLGDAGYNGNRKPWQALVPCQFNCWRIRCVVTNSNDTQDGQSVCCVCPVFVCFPRRILRSNCKQDRWHFYTFSLFSVHNHWQKHFRQRVIFSRGHSWYDFFLKRV